MARRKRPPYTHLSPRAAARKDLWWKGAVIYQVYPRSFQDSDGDGVGDLKGITSRLEYIERLGVDAVWISPFCQSPQKDYGYDVADYCAVDPLFGTIADLDALVAEAHRMGLKVMMDFVPSHTSDRHAWFLESRQDRTNPKADWYVWADARPDGTPPNNWLSVFGGSAWQWEPRRAQYYLHNFLKEQPDLNFHAPQVIEALMAQARFWLERGVDGFRVDAIDFGVHDPSLRNNPPRRARAIGGSAPGSPFTMQRQLWNKARPELIELFLKPLHALTEGWPGKVVLGEISGDDALLRAAEYTNGGGLDIAYSFDLLECPGTPAGVRAVVASLEKTLGEGWGCWSLGNHDVRRAVSRWGGDDPPEDLRRLLPILLCSLRGTVCLYQGEELGLEQATLTFDQIRDPFGKEFWPTFAGRDGCRTPMPWEAEAMEAGFTTGEPWLPIPASHRRRAVDVQEPDPGSILNTTRAFLDWRRERHPLVTGSLRFLRAPDDVLAFERANAADRILCLFNLGPTEQIYKAAGPIREAGFASAGAAIAGRTITLPPFGFAFAHLE